MTAEERPPSLPLLPSVLVVSSPIIPPRVLTIRLRCPSRPPRPPRPPRPRSPPNCRGLRRGLVLDISYHPLEPPPLTVDIRTPTADLSSGRSRDARARCGSVLKWRNPVHACTAPLARSVSAESRRCAIPITAPTVLALDDLALPVDPAFLEYYADKMPSASATANGHATIARSARSQISAASTTSLLPATD